MAALVIIPYLIGSVIGGYEERQFEKLKVENPAEYERITAKKIGELEKEVAAVPVSNHQKNIDLYKKLLALQPGNQRYADKIARYQAAQVSNEQNPEARLNWVETLSGLSSNQRAVLRQGAIAVLAKDRNCTEVTFGYTSTSSKGSYYVTCIARRDGLAYNVWFSPDELRASGAKLGAPEAYPELAAREKCNEAIREQVVHLSSLDIHNFAGYGTDVANNGNRVIEQVFTAKNSFGLELKYLARCLIEPDGTLEFALKETGE